MRVLHIIPSISPGRGGPSAVIFPMLAALRVRGIDAEIATSDEDFDSSQLVGGCGTQGSVPVQFFPRARAPFRALREYAFCPTFTAWLEQNVGRYDLLHVHALFSHLPSMAMRTARNRGVPYIIRPLGLLGRWPMSQSVLRKKLYLRLLESRNLRSADALHFTSELERNEATDVLPVERSVIIPHGIDVSVPLTGARAQLGSRLGVAPDRKLILFLGRIHPKKGIDWLVRALAQIPSPSPILLIAGEGEDRPRIERLARTLGVEASVRWLGQIAGEWKQLCLQGADLFALTSHHENFGVSVLEALEAGTPVLVSDQVALAREIARHRLGVVVPLELDAIRTGLTRCLAMPDGDAGRRRAFVGEHYSWRANAAALEQLYECVTKNRTGRNEIRRIQHPCPKS